MIILKGSINLNDFHFDVEDFFIHNVKKCGSHRKYSLMLKKEKTFEKEGYLSFHHQSLRIEIYAQ